MPSELSVVIRGETHYLETRSSEISVVDAETMHSAVALMSSANKTLDRVKLEREKVTKPLNDALKAERARWKPLEDACINAVATLKNKMLAYQRVQDEERAKKEAQIMKRVEKGTMREDTAVNKLAALPDVDAQVSTDNGAVQWRTIKKLVIVDALQIPREYLTVDEVKVRAALVAGVVIPGAELREEKTLANFR